MSPTTSDEESIATMNVATTCGRTAPFPSTADLAMHLSAHGFLTRSPGRTPVPSRVDDTRPARARRPVGSSDGE